MKILHFVIFFLQLVLFITSCGRVPKDRDNAIEDPITTYSIVKYDSSNGITTISVANNPLKVRECIKSYQIPENTFYEKRSKIYNLFDRLKHLTLARDSDIYDEVDSLNYLTIHYLKDILQDAKSIKYPLRHPMLTLVTSPDKNLRIYSWNENIGLSLKSYINVYQYQDANDSIITGFNEDIDSENELDCYSGKVCKINEISTENDSVKLYLLQFNGDMGNGKYYKGANVLKIGFDGFDFDYPSFDGSHHKILRYDKNDILKFNYIPNKAVLKIFFINNKDEENDTISLTYKFDGRKFQEEDL